MDDKESLITANLIVVCGPHAVGKMTVAESLRDKLRCNTLFVVYTERAMPEEEGRRI